ncbi:cytochrome b/b6 domain-containing protein [Lentibacter sp. XHP0401]|jgi:cytochrome b|uniref:cytochrome b/b6 domain-containing protein n=1 Tax=Lentibacter sp. XHP0401 TaxID=2984334 RepID=UPI0021E8E82C|nr:cytochrome b/b6 domain-containing protein [Lentibacter sp. XHP0401]MCV2892944.1 cytochrome b/b6 domain-containing protein [Lentibacter sp. XHP0401]
MKHIYVWDIFVRCFHWLLVLGFAANALIIDDDSKLHIWVGYCVLALVLARIVWGFVGRGYARFASFPPSVRGAAAQLTDIATQRNHAHVGHSPLGALMIYNLIASLLVLGLSGYLMTTDMFWGTEWTEELHELAAIWTEASVIVHILAALFESKRTRVNLPKAMVTGFKDMPEE